MIEIVPLSDSLLERIVKQVDRSSLEFFEYNFLSDHQLKEYLCYILEDTLKENESKTLVAIENLEPFGFVSIIKNNFDSQTFGFPCFKLSINIFSGLFERVKEIAKSLLNGVEQYCMQFGPKFYLYLSLNNNSFNCQPIFNSLTNEGYYFINTLLTFSLLEKKGYFLEKMGNGIQIREVRKEDVDSVSSLAEKSFLYSRFHMDPFLDHKKANLLLKISAENSILKNFVDIMFVAEIDNKIVGYYSAKKRFICAFNRTIGVSVISAVDSNYHRMGIFTNLDNYILNWYSNNCDFTEIGTYIGNFPVHKTWISKNLRLIRGSYQFSKFYDFNK